VFQIIFLYANQMMVALYFELKIHSDITPHITGNFMGAALEQREMRP
jgi:hypothetical protein